MIVTEKLRFFKKASYMEMISNFKKEKNTKILKGKCILLPRFTYGYHFTSFILSFVICSLIEYLFFCHGLYLLAISNPHSNFMQYYSYFRYWRAKAFRYKEIKWSSVIFCLFSLYVYPSFPLENSSSPSMWFRWLGALCSRGGSLFQA